MNGGGERATAAASARLTASILAYGRNLDHASLALTLLAIAGAFWPGSPPFTRILLFLTAGLGVAAKFLAWRVEVDARIFSDWAQRWGRGGECDPSCDLAAFDDALEGIAGHRGGTGLRPLAARVAGALALLRWQAVVTGLQFAAVLGAAVAMPGGGVTGRAGVAVAGVFA